MAIAKIARHEKSDDELMNRQISGGLFADKLKLTSIDWLNDGIYQQ